MRANIHWKRGAMIAVLLLAACGSDHRSAPAPAPVADATGATVNELQLGSRRHANRRGASPAQTRITRASGRHATAGPGSTDHR